jgi:hypothetical protein
VFFFSVYWFGPNVSTTYGPVATGFSFAQVSGSVTSFQMCSGTISCWLMMYAAGTSAAFRWKTTVSPFTSIESMCCHSPWVSRAGVALIRLNVKSTSAGVNGFPSDQVTPLRIV